MNNSNANYYFSSLCTNSPNSVARRRALGLVLALGRRLHLWSRLGRTSTHLHGPDSQINVKTKSTPPNNIKGKTEGVPWLNTENGLVIPFAWSSSTLNDFRG